MITFREFMERALYDSERGYYASGKARIGRAGDYFTNVSVGPLFGRLIARQFEEMWERLGKPAAFTIVEQGAHEGDFAMDVLSAIGGGFAEAVEYAIIEPFPVPRAAQQARLAGWGSRVKWLPSLEALPAFTGVHFSNELLDAMPVHLVVFRGGEWRERMVSGGEFRDGPLSSEALRERLAALRPPEIEGYTTEVCLDALDWMDAVAARLERGFVLMVDYGWTRDAYYSPERAAGTLACYRSHRRVADPLADPGEQDITAHVDFTSVAERAQARGLEMMGFADQHHFMVGVGRAVMEGASERDRRAFQTLMHPGLMGAAFKYLCVGRGASDGGRLAGFEFGRMEVLGRGAV